MVLNIVERQKEAALEHARAVNHRDRKLAELAGFDHRASVDFVACLSPADELDAETGVFVVQVVQRRRGSERITFTTVVRGRNDRIHFWTLDYAVLHALAQEAVGYHSDQGAAATFAGRVLGLAPDSTYSDE